MPSWPSTLPCLQHLQGLDWTPVAGVEIVPMELGPPASELRYTGDMDDISGVLRCRNRGEAVAIYNFWKTDLSRGVLPFDGEHPATLATVSFLFMAPPRMARNGTIYSVSIKLRKRP